MCSLKKIINVSWTFLRCKPAVILKYEQRKEASMGYPNNRKVKADKDIDTRVIKMELNRKHFIFKDCR